MILLYIFKYLIILLCDGTRQSVRELTKRLDAIEKRNWTHGTVVGKEELRSFKANVGLGVTLRPVHGVVVGLAFGEGPGDAVAAVEELGIEYARGTHAVGQDVVATMIVPQEGILKLLVRQTVPRALAQRLE